MNTLVKVELNVAQIDRLSEIAKDIGLITLGSVVLPAIFGKFQILLIVFGLALALIMWLVSLWLIRTKTYDTD